MGAPTDQFPRETGGLPAATPAELVELADGTALRAADRAGGQAASATPRCGCSPTTAPSPARRCGSARARRSWSTSTTRATWRRPCTGTGCAWTTASTARTRPRHPIPIGGRFSCRVDVPRPRRLLVPPAHPRGLRPGDGPLRQRHRRPRGPRLLAAGAPRARAHARRRPASRTARSRRSAARRPRTRRWVASATSLLVAGEPELALTAQAGRGRALST